jgi:hypothetical protein
MSAAIAAAVIGAAVVGAGTSFYMADEQKKASEDAQRRVDAENARQQAEALRISRETRPEGETAGSAVKLGVMDDDMMGVNDFLIKKPTQASPSGLNATASSGLGFVL